MNFIVDFYKDLETLDLIIFWGIIVVIILLLIFSIIMINKNNKLKKLVNKKTQKEISDDKYEELPIKNEKNQLELSINNQPDKENETSVILPELPQIQIDEKENEKKILETIQTEKKFIAEEHVMEYNKELFSIPNIQKADQQINKQLEINQDNNIKKTKQLEMPTGPYQRNVLREMSLSQTSPIGLTTPKKKNDENYELAKDLEDSLNIESNENYEDKNKLNQDEKKLDVKEIPKYTQKYNEELSENKESKLIQKNNVIKEYTNNNDCKEIYIENKYDKKENAKENIKDKNQEKIQIEQSNTKEIKQNNNKELQSQQLSQKYPIENEIIKKELSSIENTSSRKTEIQKNEQKEISSNIEKNLSNHKHQETLVYERNKYETENTNKQPDIDPTVKELLNSVSPIEQLPKKNNASEKYLEEVSKKLAEADVSDGIERTDYELEQEENAIISYKELMEKKDSIQTIDEEEAVISIEELMNRNNKQQEKKEKDTDTKLYNLTDEEENDDFIKELKQFRNDL